jgi:hypothetical protein
MRARRMNDRPAASIAFWFASLTMPASATTTSGSWWAAMNASMTGSIVFVSARLPSNQAAVDGGARPGVTSDESARRRRSDHPGSWVRQFNRAKMLQSVAITAATGKSHVLVALGVAAVEADTGFATSPPLSSGRRFTGHWPTTVSAA